MTAVTRLFALSTLIGLQANKPQNLGGHLLTYWGLPLFFPERSNYGPLSFIQTQIVDKPLQSLLRSR